MNSNNEKDELYALVLVTELINTNQLISASTNQLMN